jgi:OOP family OmpA-OmpF porin
MLAEHPELRLSIEGHTDADGDDDFNRELSERRADSVRRYLVERYGVDGGRLEAVGHGEARPVADNDTPVGKQQNRRVELVRIG